MPLENPLQGLFVSAIFLTLLVLSLESYYKARAKERQRLSEGRGVKKGVQKSAPVNDDAGEVRDKLAEKAGVSHDTI